MTQNKVRGQLLNLYFFFVYLSVLALSLRYPQTHAFYDLRTSLFVVAVLLTYGFIYILPALLLTKLVHRLLQPWQDVGRQTPRWATAAIYAVAVLTSSVTLLLVFADGFIFNLYGFHLNGFVWNLITTPGGIESLGGSPSTMVAVIALVAGLLLLQAGLLAGTSRLLRAGTRRVKPLPRAYRYLLLTLLLLSAGERLTYGISELQGHTPTLMAAGDFPLYKGTTLHSLARTFGYEASGNNRLSLEIDADSLIYPLKPLRVETPTRPYNIVWLMAESLRADMLDPEIMPAAWEFGQQSRRFTQHYSGGNGTRMAIFSSFYGLYGPYWFSFLGSQRSPVLMDVLQDQNYQFGLYTSQSFTYPELDKTVFAKIPRTFLHEAKDGASWERDRKNTGDLIEFIQRRDHARPFMSFMFFESPHARYDFPDESVIRRPYLKDFNYVTTSFERDMGLIKNRYINSCHHLDSQIKRILEFIRQEGLLDNTIVLLTGDHGEEFLEKGHWGHNSAFTEEQALVPLVLWIPGKGAGTIDRMTSHLDIPATLLPLLGVKNPPADYSMGNDLFGLEVRDFTVVADWERLGYITDSAKMYIPLKSGAGLLSQVTDKDDVHSTFVQGDLRLDKVKILTGLMRDLKKFKKSI